jgi:peptidoglycan-associated lipoprotein
MNSMRMIFLMAVCTVAVSVACGKKAAVASLPMPAPAVDEAPPAPPAPPPPSPAPTPIAAALSEEELFARKTLDELNAERPLADAFFDVDEAAIREDARPALQRNAEWLRRWTSTRVTIEGHCDARGTREYNLALGERRAGAVKDYLVSLGVDADRVAVISKGKESPVCFDESEECWQQNRRAHPIITAK